jgi:FkbM family methyltransferase
VLTRFPDAVGVAFEPDPSNASLLEQNLRANELQDRVSVFEIALADRDGELELELSGDNLGDHRIRTSWHEGSFGEERREVRRVSARRFDGLGDVGVPLDGSTLVSLDAQGYEGHILAGGSSLLACPMLVEFWPYGLNRADGLRRFLSVLGTYSAILELRGEPREISPADLERMTGGLGVHSTDLLLVP